MWNELIEKDQIKVLEYWEIDLLEKLPMDYNDTMLTVLGRRYRSKRFETGFMCALFDFEERVSAYDRGVAAWLSRDPRGKKAGSWIELYNYLAEVDNEEREWLVLEILRG